MVTEDPDAMKKHHLDKILLRKNANRLRHDQPADCKSMKQLQLVI